MARRYLVISPGVLSDKGTFYIFTVNSHQSNADIDVCDVRYSLRALYSFIAPQSKTPPAPLMIILQSITVIDRGPSQSVMQLSVTFTPLQT